jgi:HEAT repeat protein
MQLPRCLSALAAWLVVVPAALAGGGRTAPGRGEAQRLVEALGGEDAVARYLAEEQLAQMRDRALPALEPLVVSSGFPPARRYAIHIVGRMGSPKAVALLLRVLRTERDVRARGLVCLHVGRLGVKEAVPILGEWLFTIRGKAFPRLHHPVVLKPAADWMRHAEALREIGSEKGIPILEEMLKAGHGGPGGKPLLRAYQDCLRELQDEAAFWKAVRGVPGLEHYARSLFDFFRRDTLAVMRLYRMKVIALGREGRWVLEGMRKHHRRELSAAAAAVLGQYDRLRQRKERVR